MHVELRISGARLQRIMPSQVIRRYSYDETTRTLFITFTSGDLYAYLDVEPEVQAALKAAGSRGRYFAYNIRNRYRYRRMGPDEDPPPEAEPEDVPRPPGGPAWPRPAAATR